MGIMVLDGIPPNQVVLMGKVCEDSFTKDGEDFIIIFSSTLMLVLLFIFFSTIVSVKEGPLQDPFHSLYVLFVNKDATIADYYQRGPGTIADYCQRGPGTIVWSPVFICDALLDDTILATFLRELSEITSQDSLDRVTWDLEFSLSNLII